MRRCFKNLEFCSFEDINVKPKTAFVFMPFDKSLENVYQNGIKKKLEDLGWSCSRADEKFDTPEIICTICKNTQEASLVIADLTGRNPNVFLEVGLAFGAGKYVLLLSQIVEDIPFDTKTFRTIRYDPKNLPELMKKLQSFLETAKFPKVSEETPETRSEKAKLRREHSVKIMEQALKPWLDGSLFYSKLDAEYSPRYDEFVGLEPKDPTNLDFFEFAKSHLESEYPEVLRAWNELKSITSKYNSKLATFLNEIREFTIAFLEMAITYSGFRGKTPAQYMILDRFVKSVFEEIKYQVYNEIDYFVEEPKIQPVGIGGKTFQQLVWKSYALVQSRDIYKAKKAKKIIERLIESPKLREGMRGLLEIEAEILKTRLPNFETKIKDVIKSVELGNQFKGKCRFCP